jgi:hypothetical protein
MHAAGQTPEVLVFPFSSWRRRFSYFFSDDGRSTYLSLDSKNSCPEILSIPESLFNRLRVTGGLSIMASELNFLREGQATISRVCRVQCQAI